MKKLTNMIFLLSFTGLLEESLAQPGCFRIGDGKYDGRVTAIEVAMEKSGQIVTLVAFSDRRILKVRGTGGDSLNLFKVLPTSNGFSSIKPYTYLIGSARFESEATFIKYINGVTIITFMNGKVLKIRGTGGGGYNMFAVTETSAGFETVSGYNYRIGSAKFPSSVVAIEFAKTTLILAFKNKNILKVRGTGGAGYNMFAVKENSNGMESVPGYNYRAGVARFSSVVTVMKYMADNLIIAFSDGKILKVQGTGGGGYNMYAVIERSDKFDSVPGYHYLLGYAKFSSFVTDMLFSNASTLIGFNDGKMLKVKGTGGTGSNMFAVTETKNGFTTVSGYNYFIGCAKFHSGINLIRQILDDGYRTIIALKDGKVLKVRGTGGGGQNMFAVTESSLAFHTIPGSHYYLGHALFSAVVSNIIYVNNEMMVAFDNNKILKVKFSGGLGSNMFRVKETSFAFHNFDC